MDVAAVLARVEHRPWPLPERRWAMLQSWRELCFAHWAVESDLLRPLVPRELELDRFDGKAWVGVVPFRMRGVRLRGLPPLPGTAAFPELNVRTYVRHRGRAGVYFFSLDATSRGVVWAARRWFRLPYFHARMTLVETADEVHFRSRRVQRGASEAELVLAYAPRGPVARSEPGSLEHFLTERYALFTVADGHVRRADVHHAPWPLQPARASFEANTMAAAVGIQLPAEEPVLHFARRLDVVVWAPGTESHSLPPFCDS